MKVSEIFPHLYFRIHLFLYRKKLSVTWGNSVWYEYEGFIFPYKKILKGHKDWIDYETLPHGETSSFAQDSFPNADLRKQLHIQILDVLKENGKTLENPICIFTSGGTASGKTSAVDVLQRTISSDFVRLDFDTIKLLLPEYPEMLALRIKLASKYVQLESIKLGGRAFKKVFGKKMNVIYEKTLDDAEKTREHIKDLRKKKYKIIVIATHLTKENGLLRAEKRFQEKGRYVPDEVISSIYSKVPSALHDIRNKVDDIYLFDNNGTKLELIYAKTSSGSNIINPDLYQKYLSYVGSQFDLSN